MDRIATLQQFLEEDPADAFSRYALALEYVKAGQPDLAGDQMRYLFEHHPDYLANYYQYGMLLLQSGLRDQAASVIRRGMEIAKSQNNTHTHGELFALLDGIY